MFAASAHAALLSHVSDTIGDSRPSWQTTHTIVFGAPDGIPAGGTIVVSFEGDAFTLASSFNYTDVALAISTSSPSSGFVAQPIAQTASAATSGVSIAPGTGPITFTLSSAAAVPPNGFVRIVLGVSGGYEVQNPSSTASYRIFLDTYGPNGAIDYGTAMVAILPAVGVDVNQFSSAPPVVSNGMPTGTIPSNASSVEISVNTNIYSACRFATSSGVSYSAMTNSFTDTSAGLFHYADVSGFTKGNTYNFYVRCADFTGNIDTTDYVLSFAAGDPTGTGSGGGTNGGPPAPPGTPPGAGGGGGYSYPPGPAQPSIIITGVGMPNTPIAVLEDGTALPSAGTTADSAGNFSISIPSLPQGTYSFTLIENGPNGVALSSYTETVTVVAGTTESIAGVLLPPSIDFATSTVALGASTTIAGVAAPSSTVEIQVTGQSAGSGTVKGTAAANAQGAWSYDLATAGLTADTYQVTARATLPPYAASGISSVAYLGVGTAPVPRRRGDLNGDGKVNLIDFSILLFHWGQAWAPGDLNGDGIVDLPDLSIMLFNWTG